MAINGDSSVRGCIRCTAACLSRAEPAPTVGTCGSRVYQVHRRMPFAGRARSHSWHVWKQGVSGAPPHALRGQSPLPQLAGVGAGCIKCAAARPSRAEPAPTIGRCGSGLCPRRKHRGSRPYSSACQISCAYSRMVRSDENHPMRAVLSTAMRHHLSASCQVSSTLRCASQYASKSAHSRKRS